ncbi:SGNH/GDSL hydrolase family protein [Deminuibacter soli]|uniref:SGNH/GDSL hydrolase family protein n=1 Tax=Deminuibacter soli TaxID=2291815 RepID=UPI001314446C|nr:SGNH/GDSL hydrolase family protein [Deminuibacter soli]
MIFLGDSITYAGDLEGGYIRMMRDTLQHNGSDDRYELVGKGVGGNKIRDLLARIETDVIQQQPDIVFLMIGINDVGFFTWQPTVGGTFPDQYELGLSYIVKRLQEKHISVILCTPTIIGEKKHGSNPMDKQLDQYAAIMQKVAKKNGTLFCNIRKVFIDTLKTINPNNQQKGILTVDNVHMNEKGNKLIAETFLPFLK